MALPNPTLEDCQLIEFQVLTDESGTIAVAETHRHVPFLIERVFVVSGVAAGETRGGHAHKRQQQMLVCTSGVVEVTLDNGNGSRTVSLDTSNAGLFIPPLIWAEQIYIKSGSILTVFCDSPYDENDYLRTRTEFEHYLAHATEQRDQQ